ncbi:MAG: hypothetical protein AAF961_00405 [Planctomycetota bacterium]
MIPRQLATPLVLLAIAGFMVFSNASAIEILDDFEDGDLTDDSPISWTTVDAYVEDGDLVLGGTGTSIKRAHAIVEDSHGWSIRARARLESDAFFGLMADADAGPSGYSNGWSMTNSGGTLWLGAVFEVFAEVSTGLRPTQHDVMLQLDTFDDQFKAWAWAPGEPRPVEPMVQYEIVLSTDSTPTLWIRDPNGHPTEARFRWAQFSSERSIPEPKTAALGVCAVFGAFTMRRATKRG